MTSVEWTGIAFVVVALLGGIAAVASGVAEPIVCKIGSAISSMTGGGGSSCGAGSAQAGDSVVPDAKDIEVSSTTVTNEASGGLTIPIKSWGVDIDLEGTGALSRTESRRADKSSKISDKVEGKAGVKGTVGKDIGTILKKLGVEAEAKGSLGVEGTWSSASSLVCGGATGVKCEDARRALSQNGDEAKNQESYENEFKQRYAVKAEVNVGAEWGSGDKEKNLKGLNLGGDVAIELTDVKDGKDQIKETSQSLSFKAQAGVDLTVSEGDDDKRPSWREAEPQLTHPFVPKAEGAYGVEVLVKRDGNGNVTEVSRVTTKAGKISNQDVTQTYTETVKVNDSNRALLTEYGDRAVFASGDAKRAFNDAVNKDGKVTREHSLGTEWSSGWEVDLWLIKASHTNKINNKNTLSYEYLGEPNANGERKWEKAKLP